MRKKFYLIAVLVSLVSTISFGSLSVYAVTHRINDAKWYKQQGKNWCWAAVSETIIDKETANFTKGSFPNRQSRIVYAAHGNTSDLPGTSTDIIAAMQNINPTAFSRADWDHLTTDSRWNTIMNKIANDRVVAIGLFNAKPPEFQTEKLKGHTTFAYWVNTSTDNILLGDPLENNNYIDVYKDGLMNTGIRIAVFPSVPVFGGTYVIY